MYLTRSPHGGALLRDCAYAPLARLASVPRIYHLHARGIGDALATGWRRRLGAWVFDGAWVIHLGHQLAGDLADLADPARVLAIENGVPDDPALRRRLGAAGRARHAERFTFEAFERRLVDALTQIIHRRGEGDRSACHRSMPTATRDCD